jgi:hypothetical protein
MDLEIFEEWGSQVRSYVCSSPTTFDTARGPLLIDQSGPEYINFFIGSERRPDERNDNLRLAVPLFAALYRACGPAAGPH